mmetsp:Transcript_35479/g.99652  ORF Transcript_35479/g.99652 Transcript_35479/m.99652 type:complete len:225 (-) Transcript_35479:226-900(-)
MRPFVSSWSWCTRWRRRSICSPAHWSTARAAGAKAKPALPRSARRTTPAAQGGRVARKGSFSSMPKRGQAHGSIEPSTPPIPTDASAQPPALASATSWTVSHAPIEPLQQEAAMAQQNAATAQSDAPKLATGTNGNSAKSAATATHPMVPARRSLQPRSRYDSWKAASAVPSWKRSRRPRKGVLSSSDCLSMSLTSFHTGSLSPGWAPPSELATSTVVGWPAPS